MIEKKLSKLQKAILIRILENRHDVIATFYFPKRKKHERRTFKNIVWYNEIGKTLATDFNKMIDGNRELKISPSFNVSLTHSIHSLINRKLIIEFYPSNGRPCLALTNKGIQITRELKETTNVSTGLTP